MYTIYTSSKKLQKNNINLQNPFPLIKLSMKGFIITCTYQRFDYLALTFGDEVGQIPKDFFPVSVAFLFPSTRADVKELIFSCSTQLRMEFGLPIKNSILAI